MSEYKYTVEDGIYYHEGLNELALLHRVFAYKLGWTLEGRSSTRQTGILIERAFAADQYKDLGFAKRSGWVRIDK